MVGLVIYFLQINFYKDTLLSIGSFMGGGVEELIIQAVGEAEQSYGVRFGIIEKIFLFIMLFFLHPKIKPLSPLIINVCFVYLLIYLYFSTSQSFINRFATLFFWGYMLVYCEFAIILLRNRISSFIIIFLLFSIIRTYSSYNNILYKYVNVLYQNEDHYTRMKDRNYFYNNR